MNKLNIVDFARKIIVERVGKREVSEGVYEDEKYWGTYEQELVEAFGADAVISFDSSFSAMRSLSKIKQQDSEYSSNSRLIELKIQMLVTRLRLTIDTSEHDKLTAEMESLYKEQRKLEIEKENHLIESNFKGLKELSLEIETVDHGKVNFELVDAFVINIIIMAVTNFLSNRERIFPKSPL